MTSWAISGGIQPWENSSVDLARGRFQGLGIGWIQAFERLEDAGLDAVGSHEKPVGLGGEVKSGRHRQPGAAQPG